MGRVSQYVRFIHSGDMRNDSLTSLVYEKVEAAFFQLGLMPPAADHQPDAFFSRDIFDAPRQAREKRIIEVTGE